MISNSEGKFHYLLVRDLSALVHGRTKSHVQAQVCPYCLYCFSQARLLTAHLPNCSHSTGSGCLNVWVVIDS